MIFKFDANQEYQIRAIEAVANLLEGQAYNEVDSTFTFGTGVAAVANRLDLDEETIFKNLQLVQTQNNITRAIR